MLLWWCNAVYERIVLGATRRMIGHFSLDGQRHSIQTRTKGAVMKDSTHIIARFYSYCRRAAITIRVFVVFLRASVGPQKSHHNNKGTRL